MDLLDYLLNFSGFLLFSYSSLRSQTGFLGLTELSGITGSFGRIIEDCRDSLTPGSVPRAAGGFDSGERYCRDTLTPGGVPRAAEDCVVWSFSRNASGNRGSLK